MMITKLHSSHYHQVCRSVLHLLPFKIYSLGEKFEWPDLKIKSQVESMEETTKNDVDEAKSQFKKEVGAESTKYRPGVPTFFGL